QTAASNEVAANGKKFPWRALLTSYNVWLLCVINFCVNVGWIFLVTWLPKHLGDTYQLSLTEAGFFTAATGLAGMAGRMIGGLDDRPLRAAIGVGLGTTAARAARQCRAGARLSRLPGDGQSHADAAAAGKCLLSLRYVECRRLVHISRHRRRACRLGAGGRQH